MRVAYDITAGLVQGGGIGRYTRELALALMPHVEAGELQLALYAGRESWQRLPTPLADVPRRVAPVGAKAWRAWLLAGLPVPGVPGPCDVVHGTDVIVPRSRAAAVITLHDLTPLRFPHFHTRLNRGYLRLAFPIMARRATAIIAVSAATRNDALQRLRVDPAKVHVVHEGVDHGHFAPMPVELARHRVAAFVGETGPYLLALGTLEPRKNLVTLLHAYAQLPETAPPLVLAGRQGWGGMELPQVIADLGLEGRVRLPGRVPDEFLPALYAGAELFVYPSYFEGFGLPVLEAMACGAPVITSNNSSLPEVAGPAAILVPPADAGAITAALRLALETPELRARMRTLGIDQARKFRWENAARATVEIYRNAATHGATQSHA